MSADAAMSHEPLRLVNKWTGEPCPTRGKLLCTIPWNPTEHRHVDARLFRETFCGNPEEHEWHDACFGVRSHERHPARVDTRSTGFPLRELTRAVEEFIRAQYAPVTSDLTASEEEEFARAATGETERILGRLTVAHASLDRIQAVVGHWEEHGYDVEAAHLAELIRRCLPDDLNLDGFCTCDGAGSETAGTCGLARHRRSRTEP